jgi:hypothetical protein
MQLLAKQVPGGASQARVVAFLAGPPTLTATQASELALHYSELSLSLNIAVAAGRRELDAAAFKMLEQLADPKGKGAGAAVLHLRPLPTPAAGWQHLEYVLDQISTWTYVQAAVGITTRAPAEEQAASSDGSATGAAEAAATAAGTVVPGGSADAPASTATPSCPPPASEAVLPPLLSARSGLHALSASHCRTSSLDRLGHLSSDGMLRPWLRNYSTAAQKLKAAVAAANAQHLGHAGSCGGGGAGGALAPGDHDVCYLQGVP